MGTQQKSKVLVLIPARFASTRFPGKPLALINGKEMIRHVYENVQFSNDRFESKVCVVTDHDKVEQCVKSFSGEVVRVDDDVPSGSERIHLAYQRNFDQLGYDLIINVQGDEPLLMGKSLLKLAEFHLGSSYEMATMVHPSQDKEGFRNPNLVKVIWCKDSGQCLYFSRQAIPFERDQALETLEWFHHVGVYSFKPQALKTFCEKPQGYYENLEKLEQLRALENGMKIGAIPIEKKLYGVDQPQDIQKIEGLLNER